MILLCYSKCTTCQSVIRELQQSGVTFLQRDIKEDRPGYEELKKWYLASGQPLKKFFNTSGLLYKSMNLKGRLPDMKEEEQLKLLASDGMLVKRPMMIDGDRAVIGKKDILEKYC